MFWRTGEYASAGQDRVLVNGGGEEEDELKMQGVKVPRVTEFRYLGSTVQADGGNEIEVMKRKQQDGTVGER